MTVLLSNLSARAPALSDLDAVCELLSICEKVEGDIPDYTKEGLCFAWQRPEFQLQHDAWVIVTRRGQIVGYASIEHEAYLKLISFVCVHPAFRNRGIGTLLLRMLEVRARQLSELGPAEARSALSHIVSQANRAGCQLLEREGYQLMTVFWRVVIEMNESFEAFYQQGRVALGLPNKLAFDLIPDQQRSILPKSPGQQERAYAVREYCRYEKLLRQGGLTYEDEECELEPACV